MTDATLNADVVIIGAGLAALTCSATVSADRPNAVFSRPGVAT